MPGKVSRLELNHVGGYFGPEVQILVDGRDLFDVDGQVGQHPAQLLDTDALVPSDPPRRIALYMCGCGCSGCGDVAPIIRRSGDRIEWLQPRQYTGAFDGVFPEEEFGPEDGDGTKLDIPDLTFDADQYLSEVRRARRDTSWK